LTRYPRYFGDIANRVSTQFATAPKALLGGPSNLSSPSNKHLAWEVADHRINVNAVCPSGVLTPLMLKNPPRKPASS